jgi:Flp pilus assembly protein TadG
MIKHSFIFAVGISFVQKFSSILRDRRGAVAIVMAIALPVVIGAAGIGVEAGKWYMIKRQAQTAADAGAFAGALELAAQKSLRAEAAARQEAARNGFPSGGNVNVDVWNQPKSGAYTNSKYKDQAIEVVVTQSEPLLFAKLFLSAPTSIVARAVGLVSTTGNACILALNKTKDKSLWLTGNSGVVLDDCSLASNSRSADSILFGGSQDTSVPSVWSAGGISSNGSSTLPPNMNTYSWEVPDPYEKKAQVPKPLPGTCSKLSSNTYSGTISPANTDIYKSPGVYLFCGDVKLDSVKLSPGTYYIDQGNLIINAKAEVTCSCGTVSGAGVTFVLTSSDSAKNAGNVDINGTAIVTLRAPSKSTDANGINYPYPGMLIIQDPDAKVDGKGSTLNGGANLSLDGALYFPKSEVTYTGNSGSTACTLIVADSVVFKGDTKMSSSGCDDLNLKPITAQYPSLAE